MMITSVYTLFISYLLFNESHRVLRVSFLCFFDLRDSIRAHFPQRVFSLVAELFGHLCQVLSVLPSHPAGKKSKRQKREAGLCAPGYKNAKTRQIWLHAGNFITFLARAAICKATSSTNCRLRPCVCFFF